MARRVWPGCVNSLRKPFPFADVSSLHCQFSAPDPVGPLINRVTDDPPSSARWQLKPLTLELLGNVIISR